VGGRSDGVALAQPFFTSNVSDEGRLFLVGMQERGVLNDMSVPRTDDEMPPRLSSRVQLDPVEVPLGPLEGKKIVELSADVHHTYATTGAVCVAALAVYEQYLTRDG